MRQRQIVGHGLLKPKQAAAAIEKQIPFVFNVNQFTTIWKSLKVRPLRGASRPEQTDERCIYNELGGDYGYITAYIKKLSRECSTEDAFRRLTGSMPRRKAAAASAERESA